jgi:hypothetical protein
MKQVSSRDPSVTAIHAKNQPFLFHRHSLRPPKFTEFNTLLHNQPPQNLITMNYITNWASEKAASALTYGIQAGGALVGDSVGAAGTAIESTGRGLGNSTHNPLSSSYTRMGLLITKFISSPMM